MCPLLRRGNYTSGTRGAARGTRIAKTARSSPSGHGRPSAEFDTSDPIRSDPIGDTAKRNIKTQATKQALNTRGAVKYMRNVLPVRRLLAIGGERRRLPFWNAGSARGKLHLVRRSPLEPWGAAPPVCELNYHKLQTD